MAWQALCWRWLIQAALGSLILYGCACLLLAWRRQPAQKLRLIELILLASLAAPWLSFLPATPSWSIAGLDLSWRGDAISTDAAFANERVAPAKIGAASLPRATAASVVAATADVPKSAWPSARRLQQAVLAVYALAACGFFARWLSGVCRLLALARTARPAPAAAHRALAELAGTDHPRVRLLTTPRLDAPIAFGWRRPAILLPEALCQEGDSAALRYCLAHEWSHVERRDARLWYLAALAQFAFFYQPLFWRLRRQVRLCQDFLADARAAEQGAAVEDYAEYLVAVARRRLSAPPNPAMGFGDRRSNLYRRILMLVERREPLERRCGAPWNCVCVAATVALALCAASLRLDADEGRGSAPQLQLAAAARSPELAPAALAPAELRQAATEATVAPQPVSLGGRVIDHDTGKPIEGAAIIVRRRELGPGGNRVLQESLHASDAEGAFSFSISSEQLSNRWLYVEFDVDHPDFAAQTGIGCAIDALRNAQARGLQPYFEQIALRRGEAVSGILETYSGQPAAGVDVLAYSQGEAEAWDYGAFARTKTDSQGRFRITLASPGNAVLYLQPAGLPPAMYVVRYGRGDLGRIRLPHGEANNQLRRNPLESANAARLAALERKPAPIE
jgi:beta-lactamase regulating signal transducer with metallopeptidase domain